MASDKGMQQADFLIAIHTGCRIKEIATLKYVNVSEDSITIHRAKTTTGNRWIPMHSAIKSLVQELMVLVTNYFFLI